MANRETSDALSSLAAKVLNEAPREGKEHLSFNALLVTAKRLAGSVLSQDETPGKRLTVNPDDVADPRRNDYADDDTPAMRLLKISRQMRAYAAHRSDSDDPISEPFGFTLEALDQYADHVNAVFEMLAAPAAGTSAYEMVAAVETQNVEVTETLIHMVAATVLSKAVDFPAPTEGASMEVTFSPQDMDTMNQRYMIHATRDGMLTTVRIEPRDPASYSPPVSFYADMGTTDDEPAEEQAEGKVHDRPLWAARIDGKLLPASDEGEADRLIGMIGVDQIGQVENRFCYHPECPAEHCNRVPDQDGDEEVTSGS